MLNRDTLQSIDDIAEEMRRQFLPPEYIPGCESKSVADKDEYATGNGWVEAVWGRHNQQRCRWRNQYSGVAVSDYVDVVYYPSFKLFVVFGQGGSGAAKATADAANVTFTPNTVADWDGSADPGNTDDALDQLAERAKDLEGSVGGGTSDDNTLWDRLVNFGYTPDEHWSAGADDVTWTGYATYTGFTTPSSITTANSFYTMANTAATRAFRYRAAATGAAIFLRARVHPLYLCDTGIMIDDGVDTGDGNGADNFFRLYVSQVLPSNNMTVSQQYRAGGGAVSSTTVSASIPTTQFTGIAISAGATGTRWTSWSALPYMFGESSALTQLTSGATSLSWTPARVGLFFRVAGSPTTDYRGYWDWYDEATS